MRRGSNGCPRIYAAIVVFVAACGGRSSRTDEGGGDAGDSAGARGGRGETGGSSGASGSGTGAAPRTGGSSAGGSTGGSLNPSGCDPATGASGTAAGYLVVPDDCGWVDMDGFQRVINGGWYAFGDQYPGQDREKCLTVGLHKPEECSFVAWPDTPPTACFDQMVPGEMCTSGEVAMVLPCPPTISSSGCPERDYSNMTGAGIAVDFNSEGGSANPPRHPWDPAPHGVIGFSFEIDIVELPSLRVEIPMVLTDEETATATPALPAGSTTNDHWGGSPYWGADNRYSPSPVCAGKNRVLFADIRSPNAEYAFDTKRMLGIQFRVPSVSGPSKAKYEFCIRNLTLLRE